MVIYMVLVRRDIHVGVCVASDLVSAIALRRLFRTGGVDFFTSPHVRKGDRAIDWNELPTWEAPQAELYRREKGRDRFEHLSAGPLYEDIERWQPAGEWADSVLRNHV